MGIRGRSNLSFIASVTLASTATFTSVFAVSADTIQTKFDRHLAVDQVRTLERGLPFFYQTQAIEVLGPTLAKYQSDSNADGVYALSQYVQNRVHDRLPAAWREQAPAVAKSLIEASNRYRMDPLFLMAVIEQESRFNPNAMGQHGEIGLMQVKPETARKLLGPMPRASVASVLRNPVSNIAVGARYFSQLRARYKGNSEYYISAYNMGAAHLNRALLEGIQPRLYRDKVVRHYSRLSAKFQLKAIARQSPLHSKAAQSQTLVAQD